MEKLEAGPAQFQFLHFALQWPRIILVTSTASTHLFCCQPFLGRSPLILSCVICLELSQAYSRCESDGPSPSVNPFSQMDASGMAMGPKSDQGERQWIPGLTQVLLEEMFCPARLGRIRLRGLQLLYISSLRVRGCSCREWAGRAPHDARGWILKHRKTEQREQALVK